MSGSAYDVKARTRPDLSRAGRMPCNSSALVSRLMNANGIVLGKTRMHELALGATTINPNGGPVLNPYNNVMHVGGSSGGTAAAVAMRLAPAGFCSDSGALHLLLCSAPPTCSVKTAAASYAVSMC